MREELYSTTAFVMVCPSVYDGESEGLIQCDAIFILLTKAPAHGKLSCIQMNEEGTFLKKLCCCVSGRV